MEILTCYKGNVVKTVLKNLTAKFIFCITSQSANSKNNATIFRVLSNSVRFSVLNDSALLNTIND